MLVHRSKGKLFILVPWFPVFAVAMLWEASLASPIAKTWVRATVKVQNEEGKTGTGFLVFRELKKNFGKTFLVTNKHVVSEDPKKRYSAA